MFLETSCTFFTFLLLNTLHITSSSLVSARIGEKVFATCTSLKASDLFWTTEDGDRIPHEPCQTCNAESTEAATIRHPASGDSYIVEMETTMTLTPIVDEDFRVYECRGKVQGQIITLESIMVSEKKDKKKGGKCHEVLIRSEYLGERPVNPPLCNKDGNYNSLQLKHVTGDNYLYFCANVLTGAMIGNVSNNFEDLPCVGSRVSFWTCLGVLVGVEVAIMLMDVAFFFKWEEGVLAYILRRTKRQRHAQYVRVDADD